MDKQIKPNNENNQILGDVIAQDIKVKLDERKNFALNLVESAQGSNLSFF